MTHSAVDAEPLLHQTQSEKVTIVGASHKGQLLA